MSGKAGGAKGGVAHECEQPKGFSTNVRPRYATQFGTMVSSTKRSAPSAGMGSSERTHAAKIHLSEAHALNSMRGVGSPGPIYKPRTRTDEILDASLRKQTRETAKRTKPVYIHGQLCRFPQYETDAEQAKMRHWMRITGRLDGTPGPGMYEERSSLSEQSSSRKPTLPRVNFSRQTRENQSRIFISAQHSASDPSPMQNPGPGQYEEKSSLFTQVDSRKDSMPNVVMSRAKRFAHEHREGSRVEPEMRPGPGAHGAGEGGFEKQKLSYKKSMPQYGFGTCERSGRDKMYISHDHVKEHYGMHSPGPAITARTDSCGKQADSRKRSNGSVKFSLAARFPQFPHSMSRSAPPGPGQYDGVQ
mmetsp:Transcript_14076/g.34091  ORF Transcript_14076/g.34091 Transcript_14076/m.34091 type:complete len:360 (-) Transcript_14076:90-1169(-)